MDKVVHFEVPMDDKDRALKFYKENFDWDIKEMEGMPYWMASTVESGEDYMPKESGAINGGMMMREGNNDASSGVIVIQVDDIEKSLANIEKTGGQKLIDVVDVGTMGRYARFKDTEGNVLGLWQNLSN